MQGRYRQALEFLAAAPSFQPVQGMASDGKQTHTLIETARARLALDAGDPGSALKILPASEPPKTALGSDYWRTRGEAMCASGKLTDGLTEMLSVIDIRAADRYEFDPTLARDRAVAGLCALAVGQPALAKALAKLARDAFKSQPGVSPYFKAPLLRLEQGLRH